MKLSKFFWAVFLCLLIGGLGLVVYSVIFKGENGFVFKSLKRIKKSFTAKQSNEFDADLDKQLKSVSWILNTKDLDSVYNVKSDFLMNIYGKLNKYTSESRIETLSHKNYLLEQELDKKGLLRNIKYDESLVYLTHVNGTLMWKANTENNIIVNSANAEFDVSKDGLNGEISEFARNSGGITSSNTWNNFFLLSGKGDFFSLGLSEFDDGYILHCRIPTPSDFGKLNINLATYYYKMFMMYKRILELVSKNTENKGLVILPYLKGSEKMKRSERMSNDEKEYKLVSQVVALEAVSLVVGNGISIMINTEY